MDTAPEVMNVGELVAWQDGSIVSRKLIARSGGNVTLFAFAEGQALSEHTTPHDALLHVIDGQADVRIEDRTVTVGPGQAVVLPAGRPHAVTARTAFKMLLTMVRPTPSG